MVNKVRNPKVLFSNNDLIRNNFYWKNLFLLQRLAHVSLSSTCITPSFNLRTMYLDDLDKHFKICTGFMKYCQFYL